MSAIREEYGSLRTVVEDGLSEILSKELDGITDEVAKEIKKESLILMKTIEALQSKRYKEEDEGRQIIIDKKKMNVNTGSFDFKNLKKNIIFLNQSKERNMNRFAIMSYRDKLEACFGKLSIYGTVSSTSGDIGSMNFVSATTVAETFLSDKLSTNSEYKNTRAKVGDYQGTIHTNLLGEDKNSEIIEKIKKAIETRTKELQAIYDVAVARWFPSYNGQNGGKRNFGKKYHATSVKGKYIAGTYRIIKTARHRVGPSKAYNKGHIAEAYLSAIFNRSDLGSYGKPSSNLLTKQSDQIEEGVANLIGGYDRFLNSNPAAAGGDIVLTADTPIFENYKYIKDYLNNKTINLHVKNSEGRIESLLQYIQIATIIATLPNNVINSILIQSIIENWRGGITLDGVTNNINDIHKLKVKINNEGEKKLEEALEKEALEAFDNAMKVLFKIEQKN